MLVVFIYFNVFLYLSYSYLYFFKMGLVGIKPLYWYIFTIVMSIFFMLFKYGVKLPPAKVRGLIVWSFISIMLYAISFLLISGADDNAFQVFIKYAEGTSLIVVFALLLRDADLCRHALYAVIFCVLFSVALNIIDFFGLSPWPMSKVSGRAAGFFVNPNISGKIMVLGMAISVFVVSRKYRFLYCLIVFSGVVLTFSRASIMIWTILILVITWKKAFVLPRALSLSIIGGTIVLGGVLLVAGTWLTVFNSMGVTLNKNTTARMGGSFLSQSDYSSHGRVAVAKKAFNTFLNNPLVGKGIGSGNDFSDGLKAHNLYLQLAAEQGIFGLILLASLMLVLWKAQSVECTLFLIGFSAFCFFTHNMFDQPALCLLIAIVISSSQYSFDSEGIKKKETQLGAP